MSEQPEHKLASHSQLLLLLLLFAILAELSVRFASLSSL